MTEPANRTRWRALEVGPGGVPAESVSARGPGIVPARGAEQNSGPSAVFGSFDEEPRPRRAVLGWLALAVVAAMLVAVALWSSNSVTSGSSADLRPGDCLTSAAAGAVAVIDCSAPDAEFTVAARFDNTSDEDACTAVSSDLVLATRDPAMLCLNYVVTVGDCLYAGPATDVGKAPCRTPGTSSTPAGLFRVIAVVAGTVDEQDCPIGTLQSLVHLADREVVCLGMP
jgi:hypothetical protein